MPTARDALLVSILFYAGLRVGEALGLSWDCGRPGADRLVVEQSHVYGEIKARRQAHPLGSSCAGRWRRL